MTKLMKRMAHARLLWFLESHQLLPDVMFVFLSKLYALNCILDLTCDMEHFHKQKKNSLALFLDIAKAYDSASSS